MSETECVYVSSRGIMKSCDVYDPKPTSSTRVCYPYAWETLKPGAIVYINSSAIPHFYMDGWNKVRVPIVLVSGDCDETVPTDIFPIAYLKAFLEDSRLIAWFSQNSMTLTKLHQIPIGLDYHTLSTHDKHPWGPKQTPADQERILTMIGNRKPFDDRISKAHANFQFSMRTRYAADRHEAIQDVSSSLVYYEPSSTDRFKTWVSQSNYKFVLSPHGGGIDCHRTWEALCLGCIPIVKSSFLDPLLSDLPVLIVKSWKDVTPELLQSQPKPQQPLPKLLLSYWMDKIRAVRDAHLATL